MPDNPKKHSAVSRLKSVKGGAMPKGVTLKRTVTIKAVVTEKFKEYMTFEYNENKKTVDARLQLIDSEIQKHRVSNPGLVANLEAEKINISNSLSEMHAKMEDVHRLDLGQHYMQGMVDGFVSVNVGDNLYEKLGGMEIIVQDGIIESLVPIAGLQQVPS